MANRPIGTDSQWDDSSHQRRRIHKSSHRKRCGPHSCHYRWPSWIEGCERYGITRSMSKKGCSPDNSAMEGFFGRLKVEFFYGRDWSGWSIRGFMDALDEYIRWYNEERIKLPLGGMSPMQYRRSLGRDGRPAREPRGRGVRCRSPQQAMGGRLCFVKFLSTNGTAVEILDQKRTGGPYGYTAQSPWPTI